MGFFRWRKAATAPSGSQGFEEVVAEMTGQGVLILTRDNGGYTVYWARKQDRTVMLQALKRSVEGRGATALEAILDCRSQAQKQDAMSGAVVAAVARPPDNGKTPDKPAAG